MKVNNYLIIGMLIFSFSLDSCKQPKSLVFKKIDNFHLNSLGLQSSTVSMEACLYNPNKFSLSLKSADVNVYVNNQFVSKVKLDKGTIIVPKLNTFNLPIQLNIDVKKAIPNALQVFMEHSVNLKITGKIKAGKHGVYIAFPINYEGKQQF